MSAEEVLLGSDPLFTSFDLAGGSVTVVETGTPVLGGDGYFETFAEANLKLEALQLKHLQPTHARRRPDEPALIVEWDPTETPTFVEPVPETLDIGEYLRGETQYEMGHEMQHETERGGEMQHDMHHGMQHDITGYL